MLRYDFVDLKSARVSDDGFIHDRPILSRSGVFAYYNADGTRRLEFRPEDEVFHANHLASLRGAPITDEHRGIAKADCPHIVGTVISEGTREDNNLVADIVIHAPGKLGKKRELSLGYSLDLDETPGVTPDGERYDAIQRRLKVQHLAVVQRGRAGNARLRMDSDDAAIEPVEPDPTLAPPHPATSSALPAAASQEQPTVTEPNAPASAPVAARLVLVRVDGIEYQVPPEVGRDMERRGEAAKADKLRADKAEAERDAMQSASDKHKAELVQARLDAAASARARVQLETEAGKHGVEVRSEMTDRALREAVIIKIRGGDARFDGKSDEYLSAAYDLAIAEASRSADQNARNRATVQQAVPAVPGARADGVSRQLVSADAARERMIRNSLAR